jgi:hypothetical protein
MRYLFLFIAVSAICLGVRAEDLRSTGVLNGFQATAWVGDGRGTSLTCVAGSQTVTGTRFDPLQVGDILTTGVGDAIGTVASIESASSLTLTGVAPNDYIGLYRFNREPQMFDNLTILPGHTVTAIAFGTTNGITVHDLIINGTFTTDLINMNIAGSFIVNSTGIFHQQTPGRLIMNGIGATIGGTTDTVRIRSLRVKTTPGETQAIVGLAKPLIVSEILDISNGVLNLAGNSLTLGTHPDSVGSLLDSALQIMNGPGTFTRWFAAASVTPGTIDGKFPLHFGDVNRNVWVGGVVTAPGTVSVTQNEVGGFFTVSPPFIENAVTFDKQTKMNWTISHGKGFQASALSARIQASGLPGVSAASDLTLSTLNLPAGGTFDVSTTGSNASDYQVNRIFTNELELDGTYYIAATVGTGLPVELSSFTAGAKGHAIVLAWTTASEKNNYGFEIERRINSSTASTTAWTKIGFTEGHGTTNAPQSYTFADHSAGGSCSYRLKQIDKDGRFEYSNTVEAAMTLTPADYTLAQNYPNPFNPTTNIHFALKATQHATLKVYNSIGQEIATLFDGVAEGTTMQTVVFDASGLASGIYFYSLHSDERTDVKKMQLLR